MPRCHITKEFIDAILVHKPDKIVQYIDKDIPGFLLEYRPSCQGTWYFRYKDAMGKMRFFRIGSTKEITVREARAKAHEIDFFVQDGGDPKSELRGNATSLQFQQFALDFYLPYAKTKKRSWNVDKRMLHQHILPFFKDHPIDKVRRIDVVSWQGELREQGLAPGTCNRILSLLRCLFNCAVRWGLLPYGGSPCHGVSPFEDNGARERYLKPEEARRLLTALDALSNRQSALALKLLLFTGARKSEILHARWEYVDLDRRLLTVPLSKSGKARHIPLSDEAVAILQEIPRCEGISWLFFHPNTGKPLKSLFYTWNSIRTELGLCDVRIHDLRHSFASFLINSGCSLYEVQKILGHCDPKVTMRYAHLADDSLIRAANLVGKYVAKRS